MIALLEARRAGLYARQHWLPNIVAGVVVGVVLPHARMYFRKGNCGGKLATATFGGMLRVSNPDRLTILLENGVGSAKAFGCGLLLARRK